MMNAVALCLVLSSLVTSGLWSPGSGGEKPVVTGGEDVIVKEGHRVVVVEYDPETGGNTKILISPQETHVSHPAKDKLSSVVDDTKEKAKETIEQAKIRAKGTIDEAKEKAKETAGSVLPNVGQEESSPEPNRRGTVEIVCDAFGVCKEKVANVMGKAKDKVSEVAHETSEKAHKVEEQAQEKVSEALGKIKDTVSHETNKIKDTARHRAQQVGGNIKEAVATSKTLGSDVAKNVTSKIEAGKEKAERVKVEGERELEEIITQGRDLIKDLFKYLVSRRLVASVMGSVHLLGFATAYGMCVWVTFVSSNVLAGALARQQFGMVQSKVYPVYFRVLAYAVMVTLIGHMYGMKKGLEKGLLDNRIGVIQAVNILCSFVMILFNLLSLEPRATTVMFERMKMEKEEGLGQRHDGFVSEETAKETEDHAPAKAGTKQPVSYALDGSGSIDAVKMAQINTLGRKLKKLNAYSSSLNFLTFLALTWHLIYLGQRLHVEC